MATKDVIQLLEELKQYALHKKKPRGGWYGQAVDDCILVIQKGDIAEIQRRDRLHE